MACRNTIRVIKCRPRFILVSCIVFSLTAWAHPGTQAEEAELPQAPQPVLAQPDPVSATSSVGGAALDIYDHPIARANVKLTRAGQPDRVANSDAEGRFAFAGLPSGDYGVMVSAPGFNSVSISASGILPGEHRELSRIALTPGAATFNVQVTATQQEIAQEQVHLQEQQRVLGVFPNFYSSYIWNAEPLTKGQKFELAAHSIFDPVVFVATAAAAGAEQYTNTFPAFGKGPSGYAKRYAADYANEASNRMFSSAIFPALFHQDPRYFYKGSGSKRSRLVYAVTRAIITRTDKGDQQWNYSRILGAFASGALSNAYHQGNDRGVGLTFANAGIGIGGSAFDNIFREFLFKRFTPKVPAYDNGKP
jgi:Carboxypeptidase regulatory-like domain